MIVHILLKYKKTIGVLLLVVFTALMTLWLVQQCSNVEFSKSENYVTDTRVDRIKAIGEWQFLTIHVEEMVDTQAVVKRPLWFDGTKRLVRIYPATLRLGFDLQKDTRDGWIVTHGDTVSVTLPHTHLLDSRFIDEANARDVLEEGDWTHADRDGLYTTSRRALISSRWKPRPSDLWWRCSKSNLPACSSGRCSRLERQT